MRFNPHILCVLVLLVGGCGVEDERECLFSTECAEDEFCVDGSCQPRDKPNNADNNGDEDAGMGDEDVEDDPNPDGEPDGECGANEALCDGECVGVMDDVAHCGGCDPCDSPDNTAVECRSGMCEFGCSEGFVDANEDLGQQNSDGCECLPDDEVCDGVDNDCDGIVDGDDNGLNLISCGEVEGAEASACEAGACVFVCEGDLVDANSDLDLAGEGNGCECTPTDPVDEVCDGVDNDCNGLRDEDDDGALDLDACPLVDNALVEACVEGECQYVCGDGFVDINSDLDLGAEGDGCECVVGEEICDGVDNDCNEIADEGCDNDEDGFCDAEIDFEEGALALTCPNGPGDCDDEVPERFPNAFEACDGANNNCDDTIDEFCCGQDDPLLADVFGNRFSATDQRTLTVAVSPDLQTYGLFMVTDDRDGQLAAISPQGSLIADPHTLGFDDQGRGNPLNGIFWGDDVFRAISGYTGETALNHLTLDQEGVLDVDSDIPLQNPFIYDGFARSPLVKLDAERFIWLNNDVEGRTRTLQVLNTDGSSGPSLTEETDPLITDIPFQLLIHRGDLYIVFERFEIGDAISTATAVIQYRIEDNTITAINERTDPREVIGDTSEIGALGARLASDEDGLVMIRTDRPVEGGPKLVWQRLNHNLSPESGARVIHNVSEGIVLIAFDSLTLPGGRTAVVFSEQDAEDDTLLFPFVVVLDAEGDAVSPPLDIRDGTELATVPTLIPHERGAAIFLIADSPLDEDELKRPKMAVINRDGDPLCLLP